jgi:glycerate dehydrogenase
MSDRIVCLDGFTLNPGDIGWGAFEALSSLPGVGDLTVYDRTPTDQIITRAEGAPYLLTNKTPLLANTLAQLPGLRYVGVLATGYNVVDVKAAAKRGVAVTNVPTYGTDSVAQHAAALMLELARHVGPHDAAVKAGQWADCPDFCFSVAPIVELTGKTLGVVGLGRIGLAFARIGDAMGMNLVGYDLHWPRDEHLAGLQIERLELEELFRGADVVSLHCPLTNDNKHMVNAKRLATMKRDALLINTSRGPLVDGAALADALSRGVIGGAGLDVLEVEPPKADNPLMSAPNCLITPHVAWYAQASRKRLMDIAADNLRAFVEGKPKNLVK